MITIMNDKTKGLFIGKTYLFYGKTATDKEAWYCKKIGTVENFNDMFVLLTNGYVFLIDEDFKYERWPECGHM